MSLIGLLGLGFGAGGASTIFGDYSSLDPLTTPLEILAVMIADCPTFRTQCALAADDAQAQDKLIDGLHGSPRRVFFLEADSAAELVESVLDRLPVAVVAWDSGAALNFLQRAGGARNYLRPGGTLRLLLADTNRAEDVRAAATAFSRFAGAVLAELADQAGVDDRLDIREIRCDLPPTAPSIAEEAAAGRYWVTGAVIEWGS
jgi:hypothetical protein